MKHFLNTQDWSRSELDALLGGLGDLGFGETSEKHEAESDEDEE